ncbi:MAG TPA: hypothetical protein VFY78_09400 [Gammaproteobacteria bacterium]|nr:hypothetical protein [Gammaproteobacteria bacterium]
MIYKTIVMLLAGSLMLACDKSDQPSATQSVTTLNSTQVTTDVPAGTVEIISTDSNASERIQLDTKITFEMLKNIKFDATSDSVAEVYSDKPLNLDPAGSTRISVRPQLFFKEELDFSRNYIENIDGAFVQYEMKFD